MGTYPSKMATCGRCGGKYKLLSSHLSHLTAAQFAKHGGTTKTVGKRTVRNRPAMKLGRKF